MHDLSTVNVAKVLQTSRQQNQDSCGKSRQNRKISCSGSCKRTKKHYITLCVGLSGSEQEHTGGEDPEGNMILKQGVWNMSLLKMQENLCNPPLILEKDQYRVKFAVTGEELSSAFKLRYEAFKLEQDRKQLQNGNRMDKDRFDDNCLHLLVEEKTSAKTVGTSRIHPGPVAAASNSGFYSEGEFKINGLEKIRLQTMEVGRSCVDGKYRNGTVLALLWAGISEGLRRSGLRYLMGCASLEECDQTAGWLLYDSFREQGKLSEELTGTALPHVKMERPSPEELQKFKKGHPVMRKLLPPLFKGYLSMGAKICSEPVFDRQFGSVDFLVLLDAGRLPERYQKHFNVPEIR